MGCVLDLWGAGGRQAPSGGPGVREHMCVKTEKSGNGGERGQHQRRSHLGLGCRRYGRVRRQLVLVRGWGMRIVSCKNKKEKERER